MPQGGARDKQKKLVPQYNGVAPNLHGSESARRRIGLILTTEFLLELDKSIHKNGTP